MPPFDSTGLVVDPSGAYFRPEGAPGRFLCGVSPPAGHADPDLSEVGVDALEVVDHALADGEGQRRLREEEHDVARVPRRGVREWPSADRGRGVEQRDLNDAHRAYQ